MRLTNGKENKHRNIVRMQHCPGRKVNNRKIVRMHLTNYKKINTGTLENSSLTNRQESQQQENCDCEYATVSCRTDANVQCVSSPNPLFVKSKKDEKYQKRKRERHWDDWCVGAMLMSNTSVRHNLCMSRGKKCNINVRRREGVVMNGTRVWCDLSILSWQARYVTSATLCGGGGGNFVIFLY